DYEKKKGWHIESGDLATLAHYAMKTPYAFHSAKGQAVNFLLLHKALQDRDGIRISFWGACLAHTLADEAACNHDPLIHYLTYAFTSGYGMKFGKEGMLDFGPLCRTAAGRAVAQKVLEEYRPQRIATEPQEALAEIMMHGLRANQFMTARGVRIAGGFDTNAGQATVDDAHLALAELGAYGVRSWLNAIVTAWGLVEEGKPAPVVTPELLADHRVRQTAFVADRPLAADALYAPWLPRQAKMNTIAVGIVVEPSTSMNKGGLSFGGRLLASAMLRELRSLNIPFRIIDARKPSATGLDPKHTSVAIVCSGAFHNKTLVNALRVYADAGGKILFIGGEHRNLLGALSDALVKADPETLPVSLGYGRKNEDVIDKIRVRFQNSLAQALGKEEFRFLHNPDTKAGWQKPKCAYRLKEKPSPEIEPLARITVDGQSQCVAAACRLDGKMRFVFIPEYLMAPYLLTEEPAFTNPAEPQLDRVGAAILSTAMDLLR
ncbi:MAG: hypothetical protein KAI66_12690, partial [Lentisphaeria bacterium]|nr:hypothetical protein [Lentisphaeria bacterium]